jgi:putative addiction module CopG family antidote
MMSHLLPADIRQRIDAQIASGVFTSDAEVLREALDALERRQRGLAQLRELTAIAEDDAAGGRIGTFDRDDIIRDVRGRLAGRGICD